MMLSSKVYEGHVVHRRVRPAEHVLRYRCFWLLLDLDELPTLGRRFRLFGYNRAAPMSFHDRDHGPAKHAPLRGHVEAALEEAGVDIGGGPIRILCMPRILGYVFNPLSVYFCHRPDGRLAAMIYEVTNTYRERHSYVIPVDDAPGEPIRQTCSKEFYVSPFMDQNLDYAFRVQQSDNAVSVVITTRDADGPVLIASLAGSARTFNDACFARLLASQPLLTLKVVCAIHWEALKLWSKRIGLRPKPAPPAHEVTVATGGGPRDTPLTL